MKNVIYLPIIHKPKQEAGMADLIDRIAYQEDITGRPKINLHRWIGVQRLYAMGEWTRAQIVTDFDLQGDEASQASHLADHIDAQNTANDKALLILRIESVFMCVEAGDDRLYHNADGTVNKAKVLEDLLLSE